MNDLDPIAPSPAADVHLPARDVLRRYGIVDRTLDRWLGNESLDFPQPLIINRRRYFRMAEIEAWERERARAQGAARLGGLDGTEPSASP